MKWDKEGLIIQLDVDIRRGTPHAMAVLSFHVKILLWIKFEARYQILILELISQKKSYQYLTIYNFIKLFKDKLFVEF